MHIKNSFTKYKVQSTKYKVQSTKFKVQNYYERKFSCLGTLVSFDYLWKWEINIEPVKIEKELIREQENKGENKPGVIRHVLLVVS